MDSELEEMLRRVDLRALAEEAGAVFSASNASKCPLHGGDNRSAFHIYQGGQGVWKWKCFTNCPEDASGGTAIDFVMRWKGVETGEAIRLLKERWGAAGAPTPATGRRAEPALKEAGEPPSAAWQKRAGEFCEYARAQLWGGSAAAQAALRYLREKRLLTEEVIRARGLGFNAENIFDRAERWGLEGNQVGCPRGITIPHTRGGAVWYVNVRRPLAGDDLGRLVGGVDKGPKFNGPRGGRRGLYGVDALAGHPVCFVWEGEFDAMLAYAAAGDVADHTTLGGARQHLDTRDALMLARALCVPVVLDDDAAADRGREVWERLSERAAIYLPPAHDATDFARAAGRGALRRWIAGIAAQKLEGLLGGIDMHEQPGVFMRCLEDYTRAMGAEAG